MREALDVLGVERIDHGNRALEDPDLAAERWNAFLAVHGVPSHRAVPA